MQGLRLRVWYDKFIGYNFRGQGLRVYSLGLRL
jgi:hypothetical protein